MQSIKRSIKDTLFRISGIIILISAILYMFMPIIAAWVMAVSVLFFSVITVMDPYPGESLRGKRLYNFKILSCLLMIAATYLMFRQRTEWVLVMLSGAVFMLYAAIVIPRELDKEKNK